MNNSNAQTNDLLVGVIEQLSELNKNSFARKIFSTKRVILFGLDAEGRLSKEERHRYMLFMNAISSILRDFGIHPNNNGYAYIIECVKIIMDLNTLDIRLRNDVYPYVAQKYELKGWDAVDHNIRNAIKAACRDNERKPGINKMGLFRKSPTSKEFLFFITESVWFRINSSIEDEQRIH